MNRGFLIVAQNTQTVDYIKCATVLAASIKRAMPGESITLLTDTQIRSPVFDNIVQFPYGDRCIGSNWKLANDWQVYSATPYEYTIKLEADMYVPRSITHWWEMFKNTDMAICTTIRNYKNEISTNRYYRKIFDQNNLPDVYNAITYFKKSNTAEQFYILVKDIFENWNEWIKEIKCNAGERATTDVVYAMAAKIIGIDKTILPWFNQMSIIHMKKMINECHAENWTEELLYEINSDSIRINTIPQMYPFHYHVKSFAPVIEEELND